VLFPAQCKRPVRLGRQVLLAQPEVRGAEVERRQLPRPREDDLNRRNAIKKLMKFRTKQGPML
jgi:hypothetical protein